MAPSFGNYGKKLSESQAKADRLQRDVEKMKKQMDEAKERFEELVKECEKRQEKISELEEKLRDADMANKFLTNALQDAKSKLADLKKPESFDFNQSRKRKPEENSTFGDSSYLATPKFSRSGNFRQPAPLRPNPHATFNSSYGQQNHNLHTLMSQPYWSPAFIQHPSQPAALFQVPITYFSVGPPPSLLAPPPSFHRSLQPPPQPRQQQPSMLWTPQLSRFVKEKKTYNAQHNSSGSSQSSVESMPISDPPQVPQAEKEKPQAEEEKPNVANIHSKKDTSDHSSN